MKQVAIFLLFFMALWSCTPSPTPGTETISKDNQALKKFYYPVDSLSDGKVYVFFDSITNKEDYWLYKTVYDKAGNQFLIGTNYNVFFEQTQFSREWIVANGTILKDYRFMQEDSATGKTIVSEATIEESVVFPFNPVEDESMAYRFHLNFSIFPDSTTLYDLNREKRFDGFDEYQWQGKKHKAVRFKVKEHLEVTDSIRGGDWQMEANIKEVYVENVGLVMKVSDSQAVPYHLVLKEIISMEAFEALKNNY